jgi:hypothetical protein
MILPARRTGETAIDMEGSCGLHHPEGMVAFSTRLAMMAVSRDLSAEGAIQEEYDYRMSILSTVTISQGTCIDTRVKQPREVRTGRGRLTVAMTPTVVTVGAILTTPKTSKTRPLLVGDPR